MNEEYRQAILNSSAFQQKYPLFFRKFSDGTIEINPGSESLALDAYINFNKGNTRTRTPIEVTFGDFKPNLHSTFLGKVVTDEGHYIQADDEGNLHDMTTGELGHMVLPEIIVTGIRPDLMARLRAVDSKVENWKEDITFQENNPDYFSYDNNGNLVISEEGLLNYRNRLTNEALGYKIDVNGTPVKEVQKEYTPDMMGYYSFLADRWLGKTTKFVSYYDQLEKSNNNLFKQFTNNLKTNDNPLGYIYRTVLPAGVTAAAIVYGGPVVARTAQATIPVVIRHPTFAKRIAGNTIKRGWQPFVSNFVIGTGAGLGVDAGTKLINHGKNWGETMGDLFNISPVLGEFTNPGYLWAPFGGVNAASKDLARQRVNFLFNRKGDHREKANTAIVRFGTAKQRQQRRNLLLQQKLYAELKQLYDSELESILLLLNDMQRKYIIISHKSRPIALNPENTFVWLKKRKLPNYNFSKNSDGSINIVRKSDGAKYNLRYNSYSNQWFLDGNNIAATSTAPEKMAEVINRIEQIQQIFPGSKPSGSSILYAKNVSAREPHDIDMIITKRQLDAAVKEHPELATQLRGKKFGETYDPNNKDVLTYVWSRDGNPANDVDLNILNISPEGIGNERALLIYRQLYPKQTKEAFLKAGEKDIHTGEFIMVDENGNIITAEQLLDKVEPEVLSVMDMLETNKSKHIEKIPQILSGNNPEVVSKALNLHAASIYGGEYLLFPRLKFGTVEENRKLLQELGFGNGIFSIASDPAKMQNALNYWLLEHGGVSRNVKFNLLVNDPSLISPEWGVHPRTSGWMSVGTLYNSPDQTKYLIQGLDNGFSLNTGGGLASGEPGLDAILGRTSSSAGRDFTMRVLPVFEGFYDGMPAQEAIDIVNRKMGMKGVKFTPELQKIVDDICARWSIKKGTITEPYDLQYGAVKEYSQISSPFNDYMRELYQNSNDWLDYSKKAESLINEFADKTGTFSVYEPNNKYMYSSEYSPILGTNIFSKLHVGLFADPKYYSSGLYTGHFPVFGGSHAFRNVMNSIPVEIKNLFYNTAVKYYDYRHTYPDDLIKHIDDFDFNDYINTVTKRYNNIIDFNKENLLNQISNLRLKRADLYNNLNQVNVNLTENKDAFRNLLSGSYSIILLLLKYNKLHNDLINALLLGYGGVPIVLPSYNNISNNNNALKYLEENHNNLLNNDNYLLDKKNTISGYNQFALDNHLPLMINFNLNKGK